MSSLWKVTVQTKLLQKNVTCLDRVEDQWSRSRWPGEDAKGLVRLEGLVKTCMILQDTDCGTHSM